MAINADLTAVSREVGLRLRFAALEADSAGLAGAVRHHEQSLDRARATYVEGRVVGLLSQMPLEALRQAGAAGLRLGPLRDAGFHSVAQINGCSAEQLAAYRGIGPASAQKAILAAQVLRAAAWRDELSDIEALATEPAASHVRSAAALVEVARRTQARYGHLVPTLRLLATEGGKAATMAARSFTRHRRRQTAVYALAEAERALLALETSGVIGRVAAIVRPQPGAVGETRDADQIRQALTESAMTVDAVPAPPQLDAWVTGIHGGTVPRVRVTHPGIGIAAAAAAVTVLSIAIAALGATPSGSPVSQAGSATPPVATSLDARPSLSPSPTPSPIFTIEDEREKNGTWELSAREGWSLGYDERTSQEPVAASDVALGPSELIEVAYVIDGDTFITAAGARVRIIGIDSPEYGACGFGPATALAEELVAGASVTVSEVEGEPTEDRYGRLLRYVTLDDGRDYGLAAIEAGFAAARYDGYDGYSPHPQQEAYHAADDDAAHVCGDENPARSFVAAVPVPEPEPVPEPVAPAPAVTLPEANEPWNQPGPDLDCKDIGHPVIVYSPDYHDLDRDNDGVGCESS